MLNSLNVVIVIPTMRVLIFALLSIFIALSICVKPITDFKPILYRLDKKIVNELSEPNVGQGSQVLQYIAEYNEGLSDALELIDQNIIEVIVKSKSLREKGGPRVLDIHIDEGLIRYCYSWGEDELNKLNKEIKKCNETWHEIKDKLCEVETRRNKTFSSSDSSSWQFVEKSLHRRLHF